MNANKDPYSNQVKLLTAEGIIQPEQVQEFEEKKGFKVKTDLSTKNKADGFAKVEVEEFKGKLDENTVVIEAESVQTEGDSIAQTE